MNIQELNEFFSKSAYSDETKATIAGVLVDKTEVTPGLISEIKDILQKELDADFDELGEEASSSPEFKKIEEEYTTALDSIEKDLNDDMSYVEKELNDLEEIRKNVAKIADEIDADQLKQKISA